MHQRVARGSRQAVRVRRTVRLNRGPGRCGRVLRMRNKPSSWGEFVRETRRKLGWSRPELARRLDTDRTTIWRWESKDQRPTRADMVVDFIRVTKVSPLDALEAAGFTLEDTLAAQSQPIASDMILNALNDPYLVELQRKLDDPTTSEEEKLSIRTLVRYAVEMREARNESEHGRREEEAG